MKHLFNSEINGLSSWEKMFQSIDAWEPLINHILKKEKLPVSKIENLKPGTNAVFKCGKYVVKIFTPDESGIISRVDFQSEIFALSYVSSLGVLVPKLITYGEVEDKYLFSYMITEYIDGIDFNEFSANLNNNEKIILAKRIREITDLFNRKCDRFNETDFIHDKNRHKRWDKYSENFKTERLEYLNAHDFGENVFVHGDLCYDNIIINSNNSIHTIDFADSGLAPLAYEHGHLASELFRFHKPFLEGYFGRYNTLDIADLCFNGLIIHDFGGDIVSENVAGVNEISCLDDLRNMIYKKLL